MAFEQIRQVKGIIRKIDNEGRIVIPMEIRDRMNLEYKAKMEIIHYADLLIIRPIKE